MAADEQSEYSLKFSACHAAWPMPPMSKENLTMVIMTMMTKSCVWDPKLATVGGDELFSGCWTFSLTKTGATALLPFEEDNEEFILDHNNHLNEDEGDHNYSNDDEVSKLALVVFLPMSPDMQVKKY